jgi:hypothetical protein
MKLEMKRTELLHQIRTGHAALLKQRKGIELLQKEVRALEVLEPIDVTRVLLDEIDRLNNEIINLIYLHSTLKDQLEQNENKYIDIFNH